MAHNIHVFILFNILDSRAHSLSWQWLSALFHLSFAYSMHVILDSVVLLSKLHLEFCDELEYTVFASLSIYGYLSR